MFLAAQNGSAPMIDLLLKAGADVNAPVLSHGETALMMAARSGNVEAVKLLLDRGARSDAKDNLRGTTALMWAAEQGHAYAQANLSFRHYSTGDYPEAFAWCQRAAFSNLPWAQYNLGLMHRKGEGTMEEMLKESINRIISIAAVHDLLSKEDLDQVSLRQAIAPASVLGRVNASLRVAETGAMLAGTVAAGYLGEVIGLRATLWLAVVTCLLAAVLLFLSPVSKVKQIPEPSLGVSA